MQVTEKMIERAREAYSIHGQTGHLRASAPSTEVVKSMLTAALSDQERAVEVAIKPLEWVQLYPRHTGWPKDWHGTGVQRSRYVVSQHYASGDFYVLGLGFRNLEEAKLHAENDYAASIRSALVDVPVEPKPLTCQCANTITDPCIVCGRGKTLVTAEWVQKMAQREGDLDATTGSDRPSVKTTGPTGLLDEVDRILERAMASRQSSGKVAPMNDTDLRKRIMCAIFDPGATEGFKGERDLTTWQTDAVMRVIDAQFEPLRADAKMLDAIQHESWDLRCFNIPTGGDDCDIGWSVIGHWQAEPHERVVAEVCVDDPRAAIRTALKSSGTSIRQGGGE